MAGLINNIANLLHVIQVNGSEDTSNPIGIAEEIINSLPKQERCLFIALHIAHGERMCWGYYYGGKAYGTIFIEQYNNLSFRVDRINNEYVLR